MKKHLRKFNFAVLALMFLPSWVVSQSDSAYAALFQNSLEDFLKIEVATASKTNEKLANVPATIYVLTKDKIKKRGYQSLSDLLESIPGIEIQRNSNVETQNIYSIRGVQGIEKFIIMQNGIRISSRVGTMHQVDYNFSIVHAERVEVILGPASALYGVDAFTGIVNIVTANSDSEHTISTNVNYGSFNTKTMNLILQTGSKDIDYQLYVSGYQSDEANLSKYYKEEFDWYLNEYSQNGNVGLPFNENALISLDIEPYSTKSSAFYISNQIRYKKFEIGNVTNFQSTNTSTGMKPKYSLYNENAVRDYLGTTSYVTYTEKGEKWEFKSTASHQYYELMPQSNFLNSNNIFVPVYKFSSDHAFKLEEQFTFNFTKSTNVVIGLTQETFNTIANTGNLPNEYDKSIKATDQQVYYVGSNIKDKFGNDLTIYQDVFNVKYQNYGQYVQFKTDLHDKLYFTLGGRYDYNSRYGGTLNPRAGIVYSPIENFQVKLLQGSATLSPSIFKAYKHFGSFQLNSDSTGLKGGFWHLTNPNLKPEFLNTYELSLSYLLKNKFRITGDVFKTKINNLIVPELFFGESFKGVEIATVQRYVNKGSSDVLGGTVGVLGEFKLSSSFEIEPFIYYTYIEGKTDGETLLFNSKNTIKGGVDFHFKQLNGSIEGLYRTKSYTNLNNVRYYAPDYFVCNTHLNYDLISKKKIGLKLNLDINNLFDRRYYNVGNENALISFSKIPQNPRRFMFGLIVTI